jgi:hypothetical protein
VPKGDTPLLLASHEASPVTGWIDSTLKLDIRPARPEPLSTLSRWTSGPSRLWLFGGGIMGVFMGVLLGPGMPRTPRRANIGEVVGIDGWHDHHDGNGLCAQVASIGTAATGVSAANPVDEAPDRGEPRPRGRIDLWIDQDTPHVAAVLDSMTITAAELGVSDQHVSEIADTVDLEPHEVAPAPWERVVIDDCGEDDDAAAAAAITLTAHEIESPDLVAAGGHHDDHATVDLDDEPAQRLCIEDPAKHDGDDEQALASITIEGKREALAPAGGDMSARSSDDAMTRDVEASPIEAPSGLADSENVQDVEIVVQAAACTSACAVDMDAEAAFAISSEGDDPAEPVATPPAERRRPRRAKRSKNNPANEHASAEVDAAGGIDEGVGATAAESQDDAAAAEVANAGEVDESDDIGIDAAAIPFLRHRARHDSRQSREDGANDAAAPQRANKSRPRPRRRG